MESYPDEIGVLAEELGLEVDFKKRVGIHTVAARGELDGQWVRVDAAWEGYRERSYVIMQSAIRPELDLGLHVRRAMLSIASGIPVDYDGFDSEHHVSADEPERARQLLDAKLCKTIASVADLGSDIDVDDARAWVRQTMGFTEIRKVLHALTRVTAALSERFAMLPSPSALAEAAVAWRAYAAREGLRFSSSPLAMDGALASARTKRTAASSYVTEVTVRLEEPLETGIALRPARRLELLWEIFAGSDVQLGDAPFDRAFTIAARDPALASVVLDGEVREKIMALRKEGEVHLGDHGMSLRTTHALDVPAAMDLMRSALEKAWQNARTSGRRGPYR